MELDFRFVFRSDFHGDDDLEQGDIIRRGSELSRALREPHLYYASAQDYSHFIVLTQSCDLVRYGSGIKSNYITIAALRPFSKFVEKIIGKSDCSNSNAPVKVLRAEAKSLIRQKVEQLLHYDLPGFFFVPAGSVPSIDVPLVAFLQLAISIKPEHYDICQRNRVGKLENVFSAKLGWLTGNQYSRVATPDIDQNNQKGSTDKLVKELFNTYIDSDVFWFTQKQLAFFNSSVEREQAQVGGDILQRRALELASAVPREIEEVAEIVARLAAGLGVDFPPEKLQALQSQVRNNKRLNSIISGRI